ncbi:MAG: hypothetical protein IT475_06485 [Aquimonas sp.]|nr:hypothetical protein [Aquimonas sp.]
MSAVFRTSHFVWHRLLLLAVLSLAHGLLNAQTAVVVDLEVRLQISPDSYVPPGTVAYVDVEIINHGPGTAVGPEVNSSSFYDWLPALGREAGFWIRWTPSTPPCAMYYLHVDPFPGNPVPLAAQLYPPALAAGESVTCRVAIDSMTLMERHYTLSFTAYDGLYYSWRPGVTDSNLANNRAELEIRFSNFPEALAQPEVIPATSPAALWGLVMLLVTSAGVMFWRRR